MSSKVKWIIAMTISVIMLPVAIIIHGLHVSWEAWHFGPSQWILRGFRWLEYRAFKPLTNWVKQQKWSA